MAIVSTEFELNGSGTWTDLASATSPVTIPGLSAATSYTLRLRSRDAAGNVSPASSPITITTADVRTPILDSVTATVKYAYSFSKLRAAYSGSCIRVKNLTTNVQTDIGFDTDGNIDRAALLTASSSGTQVLGIQKYYDQSGNGIDQPVGSSYDTIDLSGHRVGGLTGNGLAANPSNGYTSTATVNLTAPVFLNVFEYYNYGQCFTGDHGGGNQFSGRNVGGTTITPVTKNIYLNNGTAIQTNESLTYGTVASDGIRQFTEIFKSGNDRARRDGVELTFTGTTNAGDTARSGVTVTLHDFAGGGGLGWTGRFFERICVEGISDADVVAVENDQRTYFQDGTQVIILGDSLAYGQATANIYTDGPAAKYKAIMTQGRDVCNRGYAGFKSYEIEAIVADHIAPLVRSTAQRVIIVLNAGTNDAVAGDSATTIAGHIHSLITTCKGLGSNVEVYIQTITKQNAWPSSWTPMSDTNTQIATNWASWGANGFIDHRSNPHIGDSATPGSADWNLHYIDDVHLTALGNSVRAANIQAVIG